MDLSWLGDIQSTWKTVLAIFGAVALIGGGISTITKALSPWKDFKKRIFALEKKGEKYDEHFDSDKKRIESLEEADALILTGMLAQINAQLTGNSVDTLRTVRDNITNYLAGRGHSHA